jgi:hypothetical protein
MSTLSALPPIDTRPKTPSWGEVDTGSKISPAARSLPALSPPRASPRGIPVVQQAQPKINMDDLGFIDPALAEILQASEPAPPPPPWHMDEQLTLLERRPRLRDQKPMWWKSAPQRTTGIASQFDERHFQHTRHAIRDLDGMVGDPTSQKRERAFWKHMLEVKSNRYNVQPLRLSALSLSPRSQLRKPEFRLAGTRGGPWLPPDPYQPDAYHEDPEEGAPAVPWSLARSIWGPRKTNSDSRDYYDTEALEEEIVRADWKMIVEEEGGYILKNDDDKDAAGSGSSHEVEEVLAVLLEFKSALLNLYNYWSGSTTTPAMASSLTSDSWLTIAWGAYLAFMNEHQIIDESSHFCTSAHVTILFEGLNSDDSRPAKPSAAEVSGKGKGGMTVNQNKTTDKKSLDRREYLQSLVRLAVMKFVKPGIVPDVSEALRRLVTENLIGHASSESLSDANAFREDSCYYEEIDNIIQGEGTRLHALYNRYAKLMGENLSGYSSNATMELPEWLKLLENRGMFADERKGVTFKQAVLIFIRSRMRCRDDGLSSVTKTLTKQALKMRTMFFCDFCEGLVRLTATIDVLPMAPEGVDWPASGQTEYLERRLKSFLAFVLEEPDDE